MRLPPRPGCRLHGPTCTTPWGYDPAHTDSRRPYTIHELANREAMPHRYAYPTVDDYLAGWKLWLALRRDWQLNPGEARIRFEGVAARLGFTGRTLDEIAEEAIARHT
ncbi:hypothetical protein [Allonocardiopsis opalescens]|uniref:Uncharacterized protein n=1 Tax=Allonocardiopsis opalescens TaxID=1144618 RepID=A0A2T0PSU1_9ACTN|nr:hypothetical protein [Allonocardiopsis opalescens]PRX91971.1 hypothetical protein CLV72_11244 [Allonocardiopsis opalescens]